jgi:hypothetical protein
VKAQVLSFLATIDDDGLAGRVYLAGVELYACDKFWGSDPEVTMETLQEGFAKKLKQALEMTERNFVEHEDDY